MNSGNPLVNTSAPILYIAVSKTNADLVYVSVAPGGGVRSKLFKTTNGGASFTEITGTLPDRYYSDIAIDPTNDSRIAVTLSGFGSSHVYLSNNGGTTWIDAGSGLVNIPANTALFDPINPTILYLGNDIGVFATNNLPTASSATTAAPNWQSYNLGFNDAVMVSDILTTPDNTKLRIATHGRGIWQNDVLTSASFSILPVTMKSFTGENNGKVNNLEWIVSNQSTVKSYEVEHSTDGIRFNKVGVVASKKSTGEDIYTFAHPVQDNNSIVYYRIKTIDQDGRSEYSSTIEVEQPVNKNKIYVYPNPSTGNFKVHLPATKEDVTIHIFDQRGRLVRTQKLTAGNGREVPQDLSNMANGTYRITIQGKSTRWNGSLLKVK